MTLSEVLRASADQLRDQAGRIRHQQGLVTICNRSLCPKCRLLDLADECERHADQAEREELAR